MHQHTFFDQFPDGVLVLDQSGNIQHMNNKAEQLLGWKIRELLNKSIHEFLCPEDAEFSHAQEQCAFESHSLSDVAGRSDEPHTLETWWIRKDGVFINIDVRLFEINLEPKESYFYVLFYDCSHRRFSHSETKNLSQFAELSPAPILQIDGNTVIFYANPSMTDLMVEHGFSDIGQPNILPEDLTVIVRQCIDNQKTLTNIESQYEEVYFTWNFHPVPQGEETLVQVYGLDISERKLYEKRLTELKELAEEHSHQKSTFLANMSHELRTPMNGIIGLTQLLKESTLDDIQYDYADKVSKSADSLLLLINDILDISKIEAGKLDIDQHTFNIREMLYETISVLELLAAQKNVNLELRVDPKISDFVIGDALRIRQIILNFLTNGVKFTDSGGYVFLNVSLLERNQQTCKLHFSVDDSGIGIPENKVAYVFGKFNQVSSSTTRQYGGTGLGLAISKELAELMQGSVGAESIEGSGSTFWLAMELDIESEGETSGAETVFENKNCFIVGGHPIANNVLDELICDWGLSTQLYETPQQVMEQLQDNTDSAPELIILCDINEEHILQNFTQFCRDSLHSRSKLIVVSNNLDKDWVLKLKQWQLDAYLFKPYLPANLKRILLAALVKSSDSDIISVLSLKQNHSAKNKTRQENKNKQVLLAEDNIINQKVARALLLKLDCQVDIAKDGQEAVLMAAKSNYDLILMDCNMPVLDGYQATMQIRHQQQKSKNICPIIALTANTADEVKQQTDAAGMDDLLTKPITLDKLKAAIKNQ